MLEFITKGTILSVATIPQSGDPTYKKLYGLFSVPEMGGTPEMLDVTNLEDAIKRYIHGLKDVGSMEFEFYATDDESDTTTQIRDTWNTLQTYETAGDSLFWKLEYPDGEGYTWQGKVSLRRQAVAVNEPSKFTLSVSLETVLTPL